MRASSEYSVEFGDQVISEVQMELFCEDERVDAGGGDLPARRHAPGGRMRAGVYVSHVEQAVAIGARSTQRSD